MTNEKLIHKELLESIKEENLELLAEVRTKIDGIIKSFLPITDKNEKLAKITLKNK